LGHSDIPGKAFSHPIPSKLTHPFSQIRIFEKAQHRRRYGGNISDGNKQSGFSVCDEFRITAGLGCHYSPARSHLSGGNGTR